MKSLNIPVTPGDIEACHRLKSNDENAPKRTIVRFVSRNHCNQLLSKRKSLKSHKFDKIGLQHTTDYLSMKTFAHIITKFGNLQEHCTNTVLSTDFGLITVVKHYKCLLLNP